MSCINSSSEQLLQYLIEARASLEKNDVYGLYECINECISRLEQPMQLAIIGKISTSKSTLVNAILGQKNVVATNSQELTYNVNWMVYGEKEEDVELVLKDGSKMYKSREEWQVLSNRIIDKSATSPELLDIASQIKYIRVPYCSDMLKEINIIDTPGLLSVYGTDSQNTIDFLSEVNPDAVIVLFTKSISEADIEILSNFQNTQGSSLFTLSPLNAVGLLAKMDEFWSSSSPNLSPFTIAERVIRQLESDYPTVRKHMFTILPISALLSVGAINIERDIPLLKKLAEGDVESIAEKFKSVRHFQKYCKTIGVSESECTDIVQSYGLYGVYVLVCYLRENQQTDNAQLCGYLLELSGYKDFMGLLVSHFRDRASLIKVQNSVQKIVDKCESVLQVERNENTRRTVGCIQERILSALLSIHEYKEWHYLFKIYKGEYMDVGMEVIEEYKTITGEYGKSAVQKLGMTMDATPQELQVRADERAKYWNREYSKARIRSPKNADLCKVMSESYNILSKHIREMVEEEEKAKNILIKVKSFLYGD